MLASDSEREHVVRRLRAGHVHGLLGLETFERRVDATLRATRRAQLKALLADLPTRRTAFRDAIGALTRARTAQGTVDVGLPMWPERSVVVGRSRSCGVRLHDDTISARHVELRPLPDPGRWLLIDLGSTNGTWFYGRRIGRTVVRSGDELLLGRTAVRLVGP